MSASASAAGADAVPVLLLKTASTPSDSYEQLFGEASDRNGSRFAPKFLPVMQHKFEEAGLEKLRDLLRRRRFHGTGDFGGLVFTSQRAVEAFAQVVAEERKEDPSWPYLQSVPIYSVGPATTRALQAVSQEPPVQIFGQHTGNGQALARFIQEHYYEWYNRNTPTVPLPPLLFLVGEVRRDIIPRTLMDSALPRDRRIEVTEEIIYTTGVMESFPADLAESLSSTRDCSVRWVVVFSPMGCDSMLRGVGLLDEKTNKFKSGTRDGKTFIATIGPTTRDHLIQSFGFEPDVCAKEPTPQGVLQGIIDYETNRGV
ncbi:Uroporphyrinogen-III synthase [Paramyrothecium foliicola]|nr:Uroporphyrinogen-III synthase [Paramyrothecium foliicola]